MTVKLKKAFKKDPDRFSVIMLTCICIFVVLMKIIIMHKGIVWGADTDWKSQHFAIPEYFRTRFYETHDPFPDFALQIGGSQNFYNYSYYGIANPLYFPAYALPFIRMSTYIQVLMLLTVWVSAIMSYYFFKGHFRQKISLILAIMYLCSGSLVYHSCMQIMFMNYIPFLLGMLFLCRKENSGKNVLLMALMSYCVMCSSFYFSIGCFGAVGTYMIYLELSKPGKTSFTAIVRNIWLKIAACVMGIICAAHMLMPTFNAIFSGRDETNVKMQLWKILLPAPNLYMIMYSAYSMGIIGMVCIAAMYMLKNGKKNDRFLSIVLLCLTFLPSLNFLVNAMMYVSGKAYIPFTPVILIVFGSFISQSHYKFKEISASAFIFFGIMVITQLIYISTEKLIYNLVLLLGCLAESIVVIVICKKRKGSAFRSAAILISILLCITVNCRNKFVAPASIETFYDKDISNTISDVIENDNEELYRFSNSVPDDITVNRIYSLDYLSTNSYSSVNNTNYRSFRFNTSGSENRTRNTAVQNQPYNVIFDSVMGCRYRIAPLESMRDGEEVVAQTGELAVFRNNYALPMGYATSDVISEKQFNQLPQELRTEALIQNIIIPEECGEKDFEPLEELSPDISYLTDNEHITLKDGVYTIDAKKNFTVDIPLEEPVSGKLIIALCTADNRIGKLSKQNDVALTINNVKNKLTAPTWKYNNKNYDFSYVISCCGEENELNFKFTKGHYTISDLRFYLLDLSVLENAMTNKDECRFDRSSSLGDKLSGNIDVSEDGWFNVSLPYDKGFHVYVDGEETEYFKTNTAFVGFPITAGNHDIEIEFIAPLKKEGMIVTVAATAALLVMAGLTELAKRKKKRRK